MKNIVKIIITLLLFTLTITSCEKLALNKDVPNCVERKIKKIKKEKVQNPPAKVWEWKVNGETYYYITSDCCDQFNYLYDDKCNEICAPDGGFSGSGDGKCPQFNGPIEKTLVWEDDRE